MATVFVAGPASWNQLVSVPRLPEGRPETLFAHGHRTTLGGTSAGKALNLAGLGADVTLRTVVGDDETADRILDTLTEAKVTVIAERVPGSSERHLNLMDADGGRVSIYLDLPELAEAAHREQVSTALRSADAAVIDLAEHSRPLLAEARGFGVPVWCDIHDYDGVADYHRQFIEAAEYLFLNDDGMSDPLRLRGFMVSRVEAGTRLVVATLGAQGAVALSAADGWHRVAATPVETIVDTNGAGDAFFSGFLFAHLGGEGIAEALRAGADQAAKCLGSPGLAPPMS
ncbi:carbohydrate kinase family protein [Actinokineospora iranica]|uniref:Sugar or nucleoside kinase, ribokinase family n=1 Tax=Actinokineospora iranica TaxID=1271860 RepID=A0A1G6RT17_9PSEU|nr:PfkB family carbohydrate kinase [Actinokineospora iranica]SDD07573.1 Sugar or nucleoside kinase, ribokinase family [Actinokineospora iranica]